MGTIKIRKASIIDIELLQKIGRQTFVETFAADNTGENMRLYLDQWFSIEKLSTELDDNNSEFYFATLDNEVTGYLKINYGESQTEQLGDEAVEIERIYVLKAFQGKKIGQLLFNKAIDISRQRNAGFVWLGVWEKNTKAYRFYEKNGLAEFDRHIFELGTDRQTDIMMRLRLDKPSNKV